MTVDESPAKQPLISPILRWFMVAMVPANIAGIMTPLLITVPIYFKFKVPQKETGGSLPLTEPVLGSKPD